MWRALGWVSCFVQGSMDETHRVASDAPAEGLSDYTGSHRRASDRWRATVEDTPYSGHRWLQGTQEGKNAKNRSNLPLTTLTEMRTETRFCSRNHLD